MRSTALYCFRFDLSRIPCSSCNLCKTCCLPVVDIYFLQREQQASSIREKCPTPGTLPQPPWLFKHVLLKRILTLQDQHLLSSSMLINRRYADVSSTHWTLSPFQLHVSRLPGRPQMLITFASWEEQRDHQPSQIRWTHPKWRPCGYTLHTPNPSKDFTIFIQEMEKKLSCI